MGELFGVLFVFFFYLLLGFSMLKCMLFGLLVFLIEKVVHLLIDVVEYLIDRLKKGA